MDFTHIQRIIGDEVGLVISCPVINEGGIFAISRGDWVVLDTVPSTGLAANGSRLVRALYSTDIDPVAPVGELMWYDAGGMTRFERVDGVTDLHDVVFDPADPATILLVSTGTNAVLRHRDGRPPETILLPAATGDGGHRNCLVHHRGLTYVTAFGTRSNHREWDRGGDTETGVLIEVESGRVVIEGLCRPHSPLRTAADDGWIIANSGKGEVLWVFDDGERSVLPIGEWPQDVIRSGDHLLVGVTPVRLGMGPDERAMDPKARLVVVAESTRTIVTECELPLVSVYDLALVPDSLVDGLRIGTATNPVRLMDRSLRQLLSTPATVAGTTEPVSHAGEVIVVSAPPMVVLGEDVVVSLRIVYRGTERGRTFGEDGIRLGFKWHESGVEGRRAFMSTLAPHQAIEVDMAFECPATTGRHTLELGLLQELVTWFGTTAELSIDVIDEPPTATPEPVDPVDVASGLLDATTRRQRKLADVGAVESWWHSIDLGDGVVTPGHKDPALIAQEWRDLDLPVLSGRSVLDIGAWDGYFSFTAEQMGAERVVAVDDWVWAIRWDRFKDSLEKLRQSGRGRLGLRDVDELWDRQGLPGKAGFDLCHRHLSSSVHSIVANYMDLDPDQIGTFDVVLYLGVLYHEPDPLASLVSVRALTRGMAVIETEAIYMPGGEDTALAEFHPGDELGGDHTNWWSPNAMAVRGMAEAVGFSRIRITKSHPPEWETLPAGTPPLRYRLMLHCYVD